MKIVVLAGGLSPERQVSLVTGCSVCRSLRKSGYRAVLVDLFMGLEQPVTEALFDREDGLCGQMEITSQAPDLEAVRRSRKNQSPSMFGDGVLELCRMADIVFLGLHGECGEDGRVQATLDLLGIPYTGAGYLSSGMAMDKAITKQFMERLGIRTPAWQELRYTAEEIPALSETLPVPCAVKVINGGSSLGLALPDNREELKTALTEMLPYGGHIIVEEKISGRDLTVGVLGDRYLPAVEIIPQIGSYFDYAAKYQDGGSLEICPAPITGEQWQQMGEAAMKLHRGLGLSVYSRTDFILDAAGDAWCLEINTLPGMTPASLLPKEAAAVGMDYETLCRTIVELSLEARKER